MTLLNPFPGPQPYRAAESARFFGRDAMVKQLANQVLARPATTVFGPSGAGKSSLMQAGVIPALERSDRLRVVRVDAWPGDEAPLPWLVDAMFGALDLGAVPEGRSPLEALEEAIDQAERRSDRPLLIYLDQVEQLFISEHGEEEMRALLQGLDGLLEARHPDVHLVLSVREDYLGRVRDWTRERTELLAHGFRVGPLSVGELVKAMRRTAAGGEPAQQWDEGELRGLMLEVRVPGQRQTDAAEVQAAFGQIVCRALWEERAVGKASEGRAVDAEAILQRYLDATVEGLGRLQEGARRLLEEHLVDEEGHRTLLTEKHARLVLPGKDADEVLERLQAAAVLHAEEHQGSRYFELGHDWLAKKVFERRRVRKERAARRRLGAIAAIAVVVAAIVGVLGVLAWVKGVAATRAEKVAQRASQMAGARELVALGRPGIALMVLAEVKDPAKARGWTQVVTDVLAQGITTKTLSHEGNVNSAAWSPDGKRIITASEDRTARVWNADGSGDPLVLKGHEGNVNSAAWNPDGKRIVTASHDKTARVWNADGSGDPLVLKGHEDAVASAASWSPDGKRIVTASDDNAARIWLLDIPALQQALCAATTDCLTPDQRQTYLTETETDARTAYDACERSHGRTPHPAGPAQP